MTQHQHCMKTREAQLWPPPPCRLLQGPLLASPDSCTRHAGQADPSALCGPAVSPRLPASALPRVPNSEGLGPRQQQWPAGKSLRCPVAPSRPRPEPLCRALSSAAHPALKTASSPQGEGLLSAHICLPCTCSRGPSVQWSPGDSVLPQLSREAAPQSPG